MSSSSWRCVKPSALSSQARPDDRPQYIRAPTLSTMGRVTGRIEAAYPKQRAGPAAWLNDSLSYSSPMPSGTVPMTPWDLSAAISAPVLASSSP